MNVTYDGTENHMKNLFRTFLLDAFDAFEGKSTDKITIKNVQDFLDKWMESKKELLE